MVCLTWKYSIYGVINLLSEGIKAQSNFQCIAIQLYNKTNSAEVIYAVILRLLLLKYIYLSCSDITPVTILY